MSVTLGWCVQFSDLDTKQAEAEVLKNAEVQLKNHPPLTKSYLDILAAAQSRTKQGLVESHHVLEHAVDWALTQSSQDRKGMFELLLAKFPQSAVTAEAMRGFRRLHPQVQGTSTAGSLAEQTRRVEELLGTISQFRDVER